MRFATILAGVMLAAAPAAAQHVYVNGTEVTGLHDQRFEGVTIQFDAQGDIRIDAPQYRVQVLEVGTAPPAGGSRNPASPATTTTTTSTPAPATPIYTDAGQVVYTTAGGSNPPLVQQTTTTTTTAVPTPVTPPPPPSGGAGAGTAGRPTPPPRTDPATAPTVRYFLVTQGAGGAAVGETVQLNINGRTVRTLDSAGSQVIVDVTDWLNVGGNAVTLMSTKKPDYVPGSAASTFQVIIGEAHVEGGGRVVVDLPVVTYTRSAADSSANSRSYTLDAR